jgi:hypothetical protein
MSRSVPWGNIAGVKRHNRSPCGIVLVPQEMVTALDAINHKTFALQNSYQLARVTCGSRLIREQASRAPFP